MLIVDNLFQDPQYVRQTALDLSFTPPQRAHPGLVAKLETDLAALHGLIWKYLASHFGFDRQATINRSSFPGFTFTRIHRPRESLLINQCRPHADSVRIAGVAYLNLPEQCAGGTAFYRHRASGAEECVLPKQHPDVWDQRFVEHARQMGVYSSYERYKREQFPIGYLEFVRTILTTMPRVKDYVTDSNEDWELTKKVEMRFNRLVCYPGFLLHSGYYRDDWFGEEPHQQRLTQNVFVN